MTFDKQSNGRPAAVDLKWRLTEVQTYIVVTTALLNYAVIDRSMQTQSV